MGSGVDKSKLGRDARAERIRRERQEEGALAGQLGDAAEHMMHVHLVRKLVTSDRYVPHAPTDAWTSCLAWLERDPRHCLTPRARRMLGILLRSQLAGTIIYGRAANARPYPGPPRPEWMQDPSKLPKRPPGK